MPAATLYGPTGTVKQDALSACHGDVGALDGPSGGVHGTADATFGGGKRPRARLPCRRTAHRRYLPWPQLHIRSSAVVNLFALSSWTPASWHASHTKEEQTGATVPAA